MMGELFGRANGTCRGKGGSMHIADFSVGMLGANGVVGAGHRDRRRRGARASSCAARRRVVVCFFGDGAINRGPFLEGAQLGQGLRAAGAVRLRGQRLRRDDADRGADRRRRARRRAPQASACRSSRSTATTSSRSTRPPASCVADIRAGGGPRFLHARTYRLKGHTAVDPAAYRAADGARGEARSRTRSGAAPSLLRVAGIAEDRARQPIEADGARRDGGGGGRRRSPRPGRRRRSPGPTCRMSTSRGSAA